MNDLEHTEVTIAAGKRESRDAMMLAGINYPTRKPANRATTAATTTPQ